MTFSELYFSFEGRVSRQTYWLKGFLPAVVGTIVMAGIASREESASRCSSSGCCS